MFNENEMIYLYYIHYDATTSYVRKDWKYQRGNQKPTSMKDRQYNGWKRTNNDLLETRRAH
jgi:uncharacterized protein YxeA